jgi:hypothetical protein
MSERGQKRKGSQRAHHVRFASQSRHREVASICLLGANQRHHLMRASARHSRNGIYGTGAESGGSICLDANELHHLGPLFGFVGDELAKVGR